jgi:hypothetical protein
MFKPNLKPAKTEKKKPVPLKRSALKKKSSFTDSIPSLIEQATIVFNAWIRKRDEGKPCISCGKSLPLQAGHFYNAKNFPVLRFNEYNVNGQCEECNCFKEGSFTKYAKGLTERFPNNDVVHSLNIVMAAHKIHGYKWDREYLIRVIELYK